MPETPIMMPMQPDAAAQQMLIEQVRRLSDSVDRFNATMSQMQQQLARMEAEKDVGYAITVHGSLNRDIDMVAVPWVEHGVADPDELVRRLVGAISGVTGRCYARDEWTEKPQGRVAKTLMVWCGENTGMLDLSVMPRIPGKDAE